MYRIEVREGINQIIKLFYFFGLWHRGDEATVWEMRVKWFYSVFILLLPISIVAGTILSDDREEFIFLVEVTIMASVESVKLLYIIWKKNDILGLLDRICVHSVGNYAEFSLVNEKQNKFMNNVAAFLLISNGTLISSLLVVPFIGDEKKLLINIGFPLDYKHNEVAFWMVFVFLSFEWILVSFTFVYSTLMWYLMFNCALKNEVLGHQIKNIGEIRTDKTTTNKQIPSDTAKHKLFFVDLITAIESHKHINELTNQMESIFYCVFFIQIVTSGLCICGSIYSLVFSVGDNYVEYMIHSGILFYNIFDIFMVMYCGNEITLSTEKLSYCLFESNWIIQPQSTKKCVIIFAERLKKPYILIIAKIYLLTLETFRKILNSAYSMFNILQNVK